MQEVEFKLRGKVIRMARQMKDVRPRDFAKTVDIEPDYLCKIEREQRSLSIWNEIRILRGLRQLGVTDEQIWAIQMIVEHDEGKFDE
ncbi:hypothetical protein [Cytobacillus firmus]|uniref:hypothetical protein n=1 Tax=Cytobacillus firmus TaxID=1399 RepID=UPI0018CED566|nr:hypothetical protein [Cytobacillus firmus]MBG9589830.1 hypothetical protein [Cytobacillus firmus]